MANSIETTSGLSNLTFVGPSSRYLNSEIVNYVINGSKFLTFKTYKRTPRQAAEDDRFYVIPPGSQYRPDIVSKFVYGREAWWWVIMQANNMFDVMDFKAGKTIIIPSAFQNL